MSSVNNLLKLTCFILECDTRIQCWNVYQLSLKFSFIFLFFFNWLIKQSFKVQDFELFDKRKRCDRHFRTHQLILRWELILNTAIIIDALTSGLITKHLRQSCYYQNPPKILRFWWSIQESKHKILECDLFWTRANKTKENNIEVCCGVICFMIR